MKNLNVFLISILLGFGSSTAFAFPQTAVDAEKSDTKKDYEKFNAEMNKELKDVDAQIKKIDKQANKEDLTHITKKRNEIDKDLYNLQGKKDPYYSELKYDIEQEHLMLKKDIEKVWGPERLPASK